MRGLDRRRGLGHALRAMLVAVALAAPVLAQGSRPAAVAWPDRTGLPSDSGAKGLVRPVIAPEGLAGQHGWRGPSAEDLADASAVCGDRRVVFERSGAFVCVPAAPAPRAGVKHERSSLHFKFISAAGSGDADDALRLQRTWFSLYEPAPGKGPRGVALLMPGLFNTPEPVIEHLIGKLRGGGWAVLRMIAQPSRFTERVTFTVDPGRLDEAAGRIAREMDDRVAECAFAVEGAFAHLGGARPDLAGLPRIAIGMSGGAMTLPTVVAREPDRYAAAVMIAGGADFLTIAMESNYRFLVDSVTLDWPAAPTPEQQAELASRYLRHSSMDAYHTAGALRGQPVLMIHGTHDGAVPARLGDLLWERLGHPERWSEVAGHEEIFMRLPRSVNRLMAWLDGKVPPVPDR